MMWKNRWTGACASLILAACTSTPDHFYSLTTLPDGGGRQLATPAIHILLTVTVPTLVDRSEMVVTTTKNGILVLDHERWAGGLSDRVSQTLARDIEARRNDLLIADRGFDQPGSQTVIMRVEIVQMSAQRAGRTSIEAHWRIVDSSASQDELGSGTFDAATDGDGYAAVAEAYSRCLSELAGTLSAAVRKR